jgi:hypothetical protein
MPLLRPRVVGADIPGKKAAAAAAAPEGPLTKILEYIPIEVIGFYQALIAAIPTDHWKTRLNLSGAGIIVCGLWIAFATKPPTKGTAWRQMILAMLAFAFWAVGAQSDALQHLIKGWQLYFGTIVLICGTMLLKIFDGILARLHVPQNE